jgi:hypothetical protein
MQHKMQTGGINRQCSNLQLLYHHAWCGSGHAHSLVNAKAGGVLPFLL